MVSIYWSDINAYFPYMRHIIHTFFLTILCKFYLSMNYFGICWTTMKMYFCLWMDFLRRNQFISMHIYIILGRYTIMFQSCYFCSLYHQVATMNWVNYQITLYLSYIQCVSVFCGLISHTSFTYIYTQPQTLTPWNVSSFYKYHCFSYMVSIILSHKWTNYVAHFTLSHWCIFVLE